MIRTEEPDTVNIPDLLPKLYYPGAKFEWWDRGDGRGQLAIKFWVPNSRTLKGEIVEVLGVQSSITAEQPTLAEALKTIRKGIHDFVLHEADENFRYDGTIPFDPHAGEL